MSHGGENPEMLNDVCGVHEGETKKLRVRLLGTGKMIELLGLKHEYPTARGPCCLGRKGRLGGVELWMGAKTMRGSVKKRHPIKYALKED